MVRSYLSVFEREIETVVYCFEIGLSHFIVRSYVSEVVTSHCNFMDNVTSRQSIMERAEVFSQGAPNDGFLLNTLKVLFMLFRVLLDFMKAF